MEHAVPQWVSRCLPGGPGGFRIEQGADDKETRYHGSRDVADIAVHICVACHGKLNAISEGWSSAALRPVIARRDALRPFRGEHLARLAHWTYKTAMMIDLTSPDPVIPSGHRVAFMAKGEPPPRTFIWLGTYGGAGNGALGLGWRGTVTFSSGDELEGYLRTTRIGHLAFQVLALLDGPVRQIRRRSPHLYGIWPAIQESAAWRADVTEPFNEASFAAAHDDFFETTYLPPRVDGKAPGQA